MSLTDKVRSGFNKAVLITSMALLPLSTACYTSTNTGTRVYEEPAGRYEESETRSFVGRPTALLHHNDGDLEFELQSYDDFEEKNYKIKVYEDADRSNRENLELIKEWITDSFKDNNAEFRVEGYYDPKYTSISHEEGTMNPFAVIKLEKVFDDSTWKTFEEVAWTDGKSSRIYDENNVNIVFHHVYTPGHMIWHTHYPYGFYPYWDWDGDGIPNQWDPWPMTPGPWIDRNHNGIWDWYDPYYPGVYWNYWGDYWGHNHTNFIIIWREHYNHHHDWHRYRHRHRDITRIRNSLGHDRTGEIKTLDSKNPKFRDPFIKDPKRIKNLDIDYKKTPVITRDRTIKDKILEDKVDRDQKVAKDKDFIRDKYQIIERDKNKKTDAEKRDTYKPKYMPRDMDKKSEYNTRDQDKKTNYTPRDREKKPNYTPRDQEKKPEYNPRDRDKKTNYTPRDQEKKPNYTPRENIDRERQREYTPPKRNPPRQYTRPETDKPRYNPPPRKDPPRQYTPQKTDRPKYNPPQKNNPPRNIDKNTDKR